MYHASRPPLRRMMAIDQALRSCRLPTASTLAEDLEASPRTIVRDLAYMRDQLRAPVEFDSVRNGYCYTDPTYRLPFFQISEGELVALYLAERIIQQLRGTPFEADLRRAISKLSAMLPDGVSVRLDAIADMLSVLPASRSHYDPECFCALTTAVVCRRRLDMVYFSASRNEATRRGFDPYDLALIDDGWYAIGYCHLRRAIRMFAIQRVKSVEETGERFDRPADFRLENYLEGTFRAFRGEGDHKVVLRFSPELSGRIAERSWHPSQSEHSEPDGSLIVRFHVNDLRKVKRWVMAWGADCRVVEPRELRESIVAELNRMLRNEADPGGRRPANGPRGSTVAGKGRARDSEERGPPGGGARR